MLERKSTKNGKGTTCKKAFDLQILQVGEYDLVQYRIYGSYTEQCSLRVGFICSNLRRVQDHHESRKAVVEWFGELDLVRCNEMKNEAWLE